MARLCLLLWLWVLSGPALAVDTLSAPVGVRMHNPDATRIVNLLLSDPAFWEGAWRKTYDDELYDELRFKLVDLAIVPMVAGEGGQDVPRAVVEDMVFTGFSDLPKHFSLAKRVVHLGQGYDPVVGADYVDTFFFLDVKLIYITLTWRVYRTRDAAGRSLLWFEKLPPDAVPAATWDAYQQRIQQISAGVDRRWGPFGAVVEPDDVYGIFILEDGRTYATRVTFVAQAVFGPDAGWLTSYASQIPAIILFAVSGAFDEVVGMCIEKVEGKTVPR